MEESSDGEVEACRQVLFKAHAIVAVAAAAAASEMPADPQHLHDALHLAAGWMWEVIDRLDGYLVKAPSPMSEPANEKGPPCGGPL